MNLAQFQKTMNKVISTSYLSLLIIFCCLFASLDTNHAGQADQLRRLINSKRSSSSFKYDTQPDLLSTEIYSSAYTSPQDGLMAADKITELPGQPEGVDFDQYAGYVTVEPKNGRAFFYYFVESPTNSSSKPLVLWLNGGPGCSSLGYGAMTELGPFRVNSDGKTLSRHPYAWNEVANVIFLESPAGVGFSYSNTTSDYNKNGDNRTAIDNYNFLINWLERFPQYKTHDFFITGESYAGHYIPELAYTILQKNKISNHTVINLQGVAIGNAYIDAVTNIIGQYQYYWGHAMISDEIYAAIQASCNFSGNTISDTCDTSITNASLETGDFDPYNIYAPLCHGSGSSSGNGGIAMETYDPCSDNYVYSYLNNRDMQKALHANVTSLPFNWEACRSFPWDIPETMLPTITQLIASGLNMWLYSGDIDTVCPITGTRYAIKTLGLQVKESWRPWYLNYEVGGYVEEYNGLTLVTVRGAGHMVPRNQPERSLTMFSSFLQGKLPP